MKISIGHAVEGNEFFGRKRELARMTEIMENKKASIFIPVPRRIGKTSLVKEFIRKNKNRFKFVYFDLESRHSIVELCKDLMKEIEKDFPGLVRSKKIFKKKWNNFSDRFKEISIAGVLKMKIDQVPIDVKYIMEQMGDIFEELNRQDFILAIDEFSDFLLNLKSRNVDDVAVFLKWLRRLRQEEKIRLVITGSVNILSTIDELNFTNLIIDIPALEILPLSREEICNFLKALFKTKDITLSKEVMDFAATKLIDGIPFHIQLFADSISRLEKNNAIEDISRIEELYHKITGKQHIEFMNLHSRLKSYLSPQQFEAARKILAHTATEPMNFDDIYGYVNQILQSREDLNKLLKRLVDESYLVKENLYYRFISPMIADWWRNSFDWER